MKKQQGKEKQDIDKKEYIPPAINLVLIRLECGITANSASVSPVSVDGNVDQIQTDWNGNDDKTIHTEY